MASTAAISLLFAIVLSSCDTASAEEFSLITPVLFEGAVDSSAAADVGDGFFVGATDEENEFRLYDVKEGLLPKKLDVGVEAAVKSALGVEKIKECDLEGAAKVGDRIFWIGSHGRNKNAEEKKERQVRFATKLSGSGKDAKLEIAGKVYTKLLNDLVNIPRSRRSISPKPPSSRQKMKARSILNRSQRMTTMDRISKSKRRKRKTR